MSINSTIEMNRDKEHREYVEYEKNNVLYKDIAVKYVMVNSYEDTAFLTEYAPGTKAFTSDGLNKWMKNVDDSWIAITKDPW